MDQICDAEEPRCPEQSDMMLGLMLGLMFGLMLGLPHLFFLIFLKLLVSTLLGLFLLHPFLFPSFSPRSRPGRLSFITFFFGAQAQRAQPTRKEQSPLKRTKAQPRVALCPAIPDIRATLIAEPTGSSRVAR